MTETRRSPPVTQVARDRLRDQIRRERELTDRVVAAQRRLADEKAKRDRTLTACDAKIAALADALADAMIAYIDVAGVRQERAAAVLDLPQSTIARMIRGRRAMLRQRQDASGGLV